MFKYVINDGENLGDLLRPQKVVVHHLQLFNTHLSVLQLCLLVWIVRCSTTMRHFVSNILEAVLGVVINVFKRTERAVQTTVMIQISDSP